MREIENEDGTKETMYTAEDMAAKDKEIEDAKKLADERGENFTKYNEKVVKTEEELGKLRKDLADKEAKEKETARTATAAQYHGNNDDLKKKIEDGYAALAGMPETTPIEIAARTEAAARLAGITVESRNPLYTPAYGEPPRPQATKAKDDEFLKSEKGIAAQKAMGFSDEEINPVQK